MSDLVLVQKGTLCLSRQNGHFLSASDLAKRTFRDPATCAHVNASWSQDLEIRCPDCGRDMFLPPSLLAFMSAADLTAMEALWRAAGWPRWNNWLLAWSTGPDWVLVDNPFFKHLDGIPVRQDRLTDFMTLAEEFEE